MDVQKALSVEEAAIFIGFSKAYLYKLVHLKKIPHYKPNGGKVFFKQCDLEAFVFRGRCAVDYELSEKAEAMLNGEAAFKKTKR